MMASSRIQNNSRITKKCLTLTLRHSVCFPCEVINLKMQIREFAERTGVSVRTLHYYDEIGLLRPACVDRSTGYRFYDEANLLQMQQILFYRELDFSLKSIAEILSSPHYDKNEALSQQKQLLTLKKERLERLIAARSTKRKQSGVGAKPMPTRNTNPGRCSLPRLMVWMLSSANLPGV